MLYYNKKEVQKMAVLDRDEYLKRLGSIITGDTDEDLKNIEDFTDTFDDLTDTENWRQKYEDNDAEWRKKYKDRFFEVIDETKVKEIDTPEENTDELESESEEVKEYDDLFEEKED